MCENTGLKVGDVVRIRVPADAGDWNSVQLKMADREGIVTEMRDGVARLLFQSAGRMVRSIVNHGIRRDVYCRFPLDALEPTGRHVDAWPLPIPRRSRGPRHG